MKLALAALLLATSALAQQPPRIAPACGPTAAKFDVTLDNTHPAAPKLEPGKALVYFILDDGPGPDRQRYTLRIGLDGSWVGAYGHNSYFVLAVAAGVHHVCANVQSNKTTGQNLALAHFIAEPGKVYYFRTKFLAGMLTPYPIYADLELDRPDSDEAEHLIASYPVSVAHLADH